MREDQDPKTGHKKQKRGDLIMVIVYWIMTIIMIIVAIMNKSLINAVSTLIWVACSIILTHRYRRNHREK